MRVLAIETVGTTGSVALLEGDALVRELVLDARTRSAQSLAPGIDELLRGAGWQAREIELVAVASGPGSFTGLRIGVTTAKTFAYACGSAAIDVDTMSVVAERVPIEVRRFSVLVDAQRGELFVADFERAADASPRASEPTRLVEAQNWLASLQPGRVLTGPGLEKWAARIRPDTVLVARERWAPTAAAVGGLGRRDYLAGRRTSTFDLVPQYVRRTAAEEQWDARSGRSDRGP